MSMKNTPDKTHELTAIHSRDSMALNRNLQSAQKSTRSHLGQLWEDVRERHIRADGPLEAVGAPIMAVGAGVGKIGNAIVGDISNAIASRKGNPNVPPIKLPDGNFAYIRRDLHSLADNTIGFGKNVITLHPVRALGNFAKGFFDVTDLVITDPLLDGGSALFGHAYTKRRQSSALKKGTKRVAQKNTNYDPAKA